ncbi:MAG TPA: FG-GAP repeat protein, partial [Dokdonella sp.]
MATATTFHARNFACLAWLALSMSAALAESKAAAMTHPASLRPDAIALDAVEQKVSAADGEAGDDFGYAVSVSGTTAAIGVPYAMTGNAQGVVFVYTLTDGVW